MPTLTAACSQKAADSPKNPGLEAALDYLL